MSKRWYNLFVSVKEGAPAEPESDAPQPGPSAAKAVADIAASLGPAPNFSAPVANPGSLAEIYSAAEIQQPQHGYTILKVSEMLQSEHIRGLPAEVRRSSILVALDAAGVKLQQVIEDAVKRDRALDAYERVLEKNLTDLESRKTEENRKINAEMERLIAEYRSRIGANEDEVAREKDRFYGWRLQKQQEEKKIADAVSYFVSENPITTSSTPAPAPPAKA